MNKPLSEKIKNLKPGYIVPIMFEPSFKILFSNEKYIELLELLLSRILNIEESKIKGKVEIAPTDTKNEDILKKKTVRDIVARINLDPKYQILIEVNCNRKDIEEKLKRNDNNNKKLSEYIIEKSLYYFHQLIGNRLNESESYTNKEKSILINFNTFFVDKSKEEVIDKYGICNNNLWQMSENEKILNINVVECYRIWYNGIDGKYDKRERDLISLSALLVMDKKEEVERCIDGLNIEKRRKELMKGVIERMNKDERYWGAWHNVEEERKIERQLQYEDDLDNAREEGVTRGISLGTNVMVINMNKKGFGLETIAEIANLGIDKIKEIISKSKK